MAPNYTISQLQTPCKGEEYFDNEWKDLGAPLGLRHLILIFPTGALVNFDSEEF